MMVTKDDIFWVIVIIATVLALFQIFTGALFLVNVKQNRRAEVSWIPGLLVVALAVAAVFVR